MSQGTSKIFKKLTKKDIQAVKLPTACSIITTPEAPLALRLQSQLLFGVSCVFREQVSYVLTDATKMQFDLQTWRKNTMNHDLDEKARKAA